MPKEKTAPAYTLGATVLAGTTAMALLLSATDTSAGDAERGKLLYENHCTVCHTSVVHVRERRKASSREDIQSWIRRWHKELGLPWGATEVDDVTEYLNDRYYRLKSDS